jgi:hypothetical protein
MKIQYLKKGIWPLVLLFILFSCSKKEQDLTQNESILIQNYLDNKVLKPSFGGKVFSSFKLLKKEKDKLYIWAYISEYYKKDVSIINGTAWSTPMKLYIEQLNNELKIKNHFTPGDGDLYYKDIIVNFPRDIQNQILDFPKNNEVNNLEVIAKNRAEKFY